ncbi:MAG: holo-ACP synthase [Hamadaea sp.]|nr:holo-ACP synthase [Hamadaea sp.]
MIVSVGNDVVLVDRFRRALERTPLLVDRLFTEAEQTTRSGNARSPESLAARFAAKEAVAKALGAPRGLHWHDCEVVVDPDGRPWLTVSGTVAQAAAELGIQRWHLSLSHDGGIAAAVVIAERSGEAS